MTKHSGYVYNNKTKEGFQKMKRQGIILPPFRIEDNVTKLLTNHYDRLIKKIEETAKGLKHLENVVMDSNELFIASLQEAMLQAITSDKKKLAVALSKQLADAKRQFFTNFIEDAPDKVALPVAFALDKDEVFQERIDGLMEHYLGISLERI